MSPPDLPGGGTPDPPGGGTPDPPGGGTPDPPGGGDPDLARLGQAFRDELRAEAEAYEELAAKDLLRRRSLTDVALELVHRGDRVAVTIDETTLAGVVVYAAGDLACLRTAAGDVDLRLTAGPLIRVVERVRSGGQPNGRGPASFVARLHEHEAGGSPMVLGGPGVHGEVRGRLAAVAGDHVVLDEDGIGRTYVGLPAIAWARPLR